MLDSLAETAETQPIALAALTMVLDDADEPCLRAVLRWGLGRGTAAVAWLGPYLQRTAVAPDGLERWKQLAALVDKDRRPEFAGLAVSAASVEGVPPAFLPWTVETFLLPNEPNSRAHDPSWPGLYLDRLGSDFTLFRRLFSRSSRVLGVREWLVAAASRGELATSHAARLERCGVFARALKSGDLRHILGVDWLQVFPEERGKLVSQILEHVPISTEEELRTLLVGCRSAWPDGLARRREVWPASRRHWLQSYGLGSFERLISVLEPLDLLDFGPDGLCAELIAAIARRERQAGPDWSFRELILRDERAWRALGADIRVDLRQRNEAESMAAFDVWDRRLPRGVYSARFFEVWLNSCETPALAATVEARAGDLRTLPALRWWNHRAYDGAVDDLRDAFARLAPVRPLDENALAAIRSWMTASALSEQGRKRWASLDALSAFHRPGLDSEACWQIVEGWSRSFTLDALTLDERHLFLAWLIPRMEASESLRVIRLADWLARQRLSDVDRSARWAEELARFIDVDPNLVVRRQRFVSELRAEWKSALRDAQGRT